MHHDVIDSDVWLSQCQSLSVIDPESHQIMSALLSLVGAVVAATMAAQLLCYLFCCGRPAPTGKVMVEKGVQTSLFETETNDVSDCQTHDVRTPFAGCIAMGTEVAVTSSGKCIHSLTCRHVKNKKHVQKLTLCHHCLA